MATGIVTAEAATALSLFNSEEQTEEFAVGGKEEWTVDELLLKHPMFHDDAMYIVCRTEFTPTKVLRDFAALVARENLAAVTSGPVAAQVFVEAVAFVSAGGADDDLVALAEHADKVQRYMVSALAIDPGVKPERVAAYDLLLKACKCVRAATKADPGAAAYGAASWAYRAAAQGSHRDNVGKKHRSQLAKIFKAAQ